MREQVAAARAPVAPEALLLAPVAEAIVAGGEELLEPHRREITAVFLDLRGFTAFTDRADPDEVMELLRAYHATLGRTVDEYGGTLEHFAGDGVMIFFSDPLPVDQPAERAVRMALALQEAFTPDLRGLGEARPRRRPRHRHRAGRGDARRDRLRAALGVRGDRQRAEPRGAPVRHGARRRDHPRRADRARRSLTRSTPSRSGRSRCAASSSRSSPSGSAPCGLTTQPVARLCGGRRYAEEQQAAGDDQGERRAHAGKRTPRMRSSRASPVARRPRAWCTRERAARREATRSKLGCRGVAAGSILDEP